MKNILLYIFLFFSFFAFSQYKQKEYVSKIIYVDTKIVSIDSVSINPSYFKLVDTNNVIIDKVNYKVDFSIAQIEFLNTIYINNKITVYYKKYPDFLTKTYRVFDENLIVDDKNDKLKFYKLADDYDSNNSKDIFEGLETTGFLSRGITMGNNQDGVVNSGLNLQLKGNLSSKVAIKATISDNNVPLQDNGYSQRLNEYDRIFVEMYSDKWKLTAGDLFLNNSNTNYLNFNKRVSGLGVNVNLKSKKDTVNIYTSGALVRGKFTSVSLKVQEANQGPYRLASDSNQFLLIVSNSETVYVNGMPIKKENYIIDYSSAEITFATTFPMNSNMRVQIDFQASNQSYNRFVSFNKVNYITDKFNVAVNFYNENDAKSKSLQQDLNEVQKEILFNSGDDISQMYTLSAIKEDYIENKIQYKKETINGVDVFVFSNESTDVLYGVRFTFVGANQGDYVIDNTLATGRVYKYISSINGIKQGDFEPKIQLIAPEKLQVTTIQAIYDDKRTLLNTELAYSSKDKNLFSVKNDDNNQGVAGKIVWNQLLIDSKWKLKSNLSYENINKNFNSVERLRQIEFNRDWNIQKTFSNQSLVSSGLIYEKDSTGFVSYEFSNLNYLNFFNGNKHVFNSNINLKKTNISVATSIMNSNSINETSNFNRLNTDVEQKLNRFLVGVKSNYESNIRVDKLTQNTSNLSFKNQSYGSYIKINDSLRTRLEVGYDYMLNDSIQGVTLKNVNKSHNYYVKSNIIKNKITNLDVYLNYRKFTNTSFKNDKSLNSSIKYSQHFFDSFMQLNTLYETSSGTIAQQEFNYMEVDVGKGFYTWKDYNNDGIQDLDEFEIAQFQDEAIYVRVLLPSSKFIRTSRTNLSQSLILNPSNWLKGKVMSHFINQTNVLIDNKQLKESDFQFNPFDKNNALALQYSFKNFLFYNRGKQNYSVTYSYLNLDNKTVFVTGLLTNNLESNQLQFQHKINKTWLIDLKAINAKALTLNERYASRNLNLTTNSLQAKLAYYFNDSKSNFSLNYIFNKKQNESLLNETLKSSDIGFSLQHISSDKFNLSCSFNYINNLYSESQQSPISYQLLEGLQAGENFTWNLTTQKSLTTYLDFNLNYNGRKSENLKTIHTGTIQLRAKF